ncbi:MAG TPA: peptidoglycan-binding protein [Pyrinomonadaceae bacterium]|nr:peptidoglycan-binding protein [Pyrinomonadaceae bacterium]
MPRLRDIRTCATTSANGLSRQILAEMNVLVPGILVSYGELDVDIHSLQFPLLQQRAKDALARAIQRRGRTLRVNSGYRTCAQQFLLHRWRSLGICGIRAAANPGRSNHESGLGLDIEDHNGWKPFLRREGWRWLGDHDPVHFDFLGGGTPIGNVGVKAFQTLWNRNFPDQRIATDGVYGPQTAEKLGLSPSEGFNNEIASRRILRLMSPLMQGGDVRRVQIKLGDLGLFNNDVDGIFRETTRDAVIRFQETENLTADGIVGRNTFAKLDIE